MNLNPQRVGDFLISSKIAESYKSIIYKGYHTRTNEPVQIKVLKKQFRSPAEIIQLKQEYKLIQNLKVEGVVKNQDIIINESDIAFIYESNDGSTLKSYLSKSVINYYEFLSIAEQLALIISKLHSENIIHKNLKPQNITLKVVKNKINDIKITDFGYSFIINDNLNELYNPGVIESILPYISPEQTGRMNLTIDYRSDLYSLGVIFYEILVRRPPFQSSDPLEIIHSHLAKVPVPVHDIDRSIPKAISEIIQKLLSKSPEDRYHSASGLRNDLESCLDQIRDTGKIYSLKPGEKDLSDRFILPQKLIGREEEVEKILSAFDYISKGNSGVILVSGAPGIGKSSIIKEVNKPIINARGYFTSGKYDQMRKEVPFSSIVQAFQNLIRQILTESEYKIQRWKRNLSNALGDNGQVISKLIPEIELIIGPQPEVTELNPEESQNRFNHIFTNLLKVFANSDHPFVLFLDDVQWADPPSLVLLRAILSDKSVTNFLLILSFRETIFNAYHPFKIFMEDIKRQKTRVDKIFLKPLNPVNIITFLETTLNKKGYDIELLANSIYEKTRGNPFFLNQFLKSLYEDKIISYSHKNGWTWDLQKVQSMQVTENVIELMIIKINKLPENARKILIYGSCIGNRFSLDLISNITNMSLEETIDALNENIKEGLIYINNNMYRFLHDRVQEAAYSLLPQKEKSEVHLQIGYLTIEQLNQAGILDKIFYIVDHLNNGSDYIEDREKLFDLIKYNLNAGKKALSSAAYEPSYHYMRLGVKLVEKIGRDEVWKNNYSTALTLYTYCSETCYLCMKYDEMEEYSNIVLQYSTNIIDVIKIYEIKIKTEIAKNNFLKSIEIGLEILSKLKIEFPKKPNRLHQGFELIKTFMLFKIKGNNFLIESPPTYNPHVLAILRIISTINSVSYWVRPDLLPLLILKVVYLSLIHGPNLYTSYNLNGLGLILSSIGLFKEGNKIGKTALKLSEKINSPELNPRSAFVYNTFIRHWNSPLRDTLKYSFEIFQKCLEVGDLEFASHCAFVDIYYSYSSGIELDEVQKKIHNYLDDKKSLRHQTDINAINIYQQSIYNLQGKNKDNSKIKGKYYDIDLMIPLHEEAGDKTTLFHVYLCSMFHSYMFNRFSKSLEYSIKAKSVIEGGSSVYGLVSYYFYDSLTKISLMKISSTKIYLKDIKNNLKKLERWSKYSSANCYHKFCLIKAELQSIQNNPLTAMNLYETAVREARKSQFLQEEALALELAGAFYLNIDYRDHAKNYILLSRSVYMKWGSSGMVSKIDNIYANLLREPISNIPGTIGLNRNTSSNLDISTILKSSQHLSSEIEISRLLLKILNVSLENAGAQRGVLLLAKKGKLYVEAESSAAGNELIATIPLEEFRDLPITIINYVNKTTQSIVLTNAFEKGMFTDDIYIQLNKIKSVLCAPIIHKGKILGILYLENNLSPNVFIKERLELLSILSSQAAISIENALLLEQREKSAKFSKEMEITSGIQKSLIPEKSEIQGFDVIGYMKPAESVGGDYFDIINTPEKDWIVIGDVSGHGILSGLIMMMVQTSIHLTLSGDKNITPSELLKIIINGIEDNIRKISKFQFKYMTITILSYDRNGNFTYAGQHQDILVYKKSLNKIMLYPTEGIWIGLGKLNEESEKSIIDKSFSIEKDDIIVLYTDGVTECEKEERMLGVDGLSEIILNNSHLNVNEVQNKILETISEFESKDDTTFLILKKLS